MSSSLSWYPPDGSAPLVFGDGVASAYRLLNVDGLSSTQSAPQTQKAPAQVGVTLLDSSVGPRAITLQVALLAASKEELWALRAQLARALVAPPARPGEQPPAGTLRLVRDGQLDVEWQAVPRDSPQFSRRAPTVHVADIDLFAAYPYPREASDRTARLQTAGGFTFPVQHPFAMVAFNVELEIENVGDVDAPILAKLYGDVTTARLRNLTTGEQLEITGNVAAGTYLEVETAFGRKAITLVAADGTRTDVMGRLNLAKPDFWHLRPGVQLVRFEADTNISGRAELAWRPRYAGA